MIVHLNFVYFPRFDQSSLSWIVDTEQEIVFSYRKGLVIKYQLQNSDRPSITLLIEE